MCHVSLFAYKLGIPFALWNAFMLVSIANKYILDWRLQNSVGGTSAVSNLNLPTVQKLMVEYNG